MNETARDVLKRAEAEGVSFIRLQFTDILGIPKNVEIPAQHLEGVLERGIAFDGSSIQGFVRIFESDMYLYPDPGTFVVHPWSADNGKTATLICDVHLPDGTPFTGDPRFALKRQLERAAALGYEFNVGPEPEFFLLVPDEHNRSQPHVHDHGGYFDLDPLDKGELARKDIVVALERMGFEVEAAHHEVAPSQHEIDFRYADALRTADNILMFKIATKKIALTHGLHATFMPKPIAGINGSGMHCHLSLFRDGTNAFYAPDSDYGLSEAARHFIGGLIAHARGLAAITNPLVNSYKRLVPGYEAPVNISWARQNRSALVRVPASHTPEVSTRVELRNPDPTCNPYLAFAAILAAGLDGLERKLAPPAPVEENIYEMTDAQRQERSIGTLPGTLDEALGHLQADEVVCASLGDHVLAKFVEAKAQEIEEYRLRVTAWELERYLAYY